MSAAADEMTEVNRMLRDEPMARHTSWRVGGPADRFCAPRSVEALAGVLRALPKKTPVYWIGLGSNLLVRDGGIRGLVIATNALERELKLLDETSVRASAGLPCALLARQCVRWRIGPASFFAGIPGSVGGALAMNAGAFGGETWSAVERVQTIDRRGELRLRERDEYTIGYRSVQGPADDEWFLAAEFRFAPEPDADETAIRRLLAQRAATQPLRVPSCGSVFRNPPGDHAGRLIEAAGLKGRTEGGAMVSQKHANFIVNTGNATAADIETLIQIVQAEVEQQFGVLLEPEVRIVGEPKAGGER